MNALFAMMASCLVLSIGFITCGLLLRYLYRLWKPALKQMPRIWHTQISKHQKLLVVLGLLLIAVGMILIYILHGMGNSTNPFQP